MRLNLDDLLSGIKPSYDSDYGKAVETGGAPKLQAGDHVCTVASLDMSEKDGVKRIFLTWQCSDTTSPYRGYEVREVFRVEPGKTHRVIRRVMDCGLPAGTAEDFGKSLLRLEGLKARLRVTTAGEWTNVEKILEVFQSQENNSDIPF